MTNTKLSLQRRYTMTLEELQEKSKDELIGIILGQQNNIDKLSDENFALQERVKRLYEV